MMADQSDFIVSIIEDDEAVLRSLCALLEAHGYKTKSYDAVEPFLRDFDPAQTGCILLDLRLPGMSGMEFIDELGSLDVKCPVIVVTAHGDVPVAVKAMRAGAIDFIEKPPNTEQLLEALKLAEDSLSMKTSHLIPKKVVADRLANLTEREREVLDHLLEGKLNKEIADELGVSRRTVEVHRSRIKEKMRARGIADLVRMTN